MFLRMALCCGMLIALTINAQTINLHGKVTNNDGDPIEDAIVILVGQDLADTTGSDGTYAIAQEDVGVIHELHPENKLVSLNKGALEFSLPDATPLRIETFDVKGNLLRRESVPNVASGFYRFDIAKYSRAAKVLIIRVYIGNDEITFRYLPLQNGTSVINQSFARTSESAGRLMKITAVNDTLKITANGYVEKKMAVSSYDQEVNIALEAEGSVIGKSAGCGKTTTLSGESRLPINVGGQNREYIIRLPDDYDPDKAYRLIMSIHCLNGTARGVASGGNGNNYEYYGLWKFANPSDGPGTTIFCSPEGLPYTAMGGGLGWGTNEGHEDFIRTLVNKFEDELCIDTNRIFAEGFSMGGSMSYALACIMPGKFRAVCMHSGGSMSGCDRSNRGPVPMFITHGTDDDVCRWSSHSGESQLNDLAARCGCDEEDLYNNCHPNSTAPVTVNYKNCDPGMPCKACIFKGGHDPSPGGERNTWVDDSTWNYFKQF